MRDVTGDIARWLAAARRVALARVVDVEGSAPRGPGATMAVNEDGEVSGSVSGGCVEGAVVTEALDVLASGTSRVCTFGYSDEEAFAVGLTCGGILRVLVEPLNCDAGMPKAVFAALREHLLADEPVALAAVIEESVAEGTSQDAMEGATGDTGVAIGTSMLVRSDGSAAGTLGNLGLDRAVVRDSLGQLDAGTTTVRRYGARGQARLQEVAIFIEAFVPPPQMLIFGAVDFSAALARVAKLLGYRVTVCDARGTFATKKRFPMADEVVVDWPDRLLAKVGPRLRSRDAICILTHDPKFDVPAVMGALGTSVGYIGAMGSRRTTADREKRLREAGADDAALDRLMAPIGLDIGARTPEETAVSICAEIVALRAGGGTGSQLREIDGAIHRRP
jgi:xanthine dehydrogenase accessory factor